MAATTDAWRRQTDTAIQANWLAQYRRRNPGGDQHAKPTSKYRSAFSRSGRRMHAVVDQAITDGIAVCGALVECRYNHPPLPGADFHPECLSCRAAVAATLVA